MSKVMGKLFGRNSLTPYSLKRVCRTMAWLPTPLVIFRTLSIHASHSRPAKRTTWLLNNMTKSLQDFGVIRRAWRLSNKSEHHHPPTILHLTKEPELLTGDEDFDGAEFRMSILARTNITAFVIDEDKIRQLSTYDKGKSANTCRLVKMIEDCLDTLYELLSEDQRDADRRTCWDYPTSSFSGFDGFTKTEEERIFGVLDIFRKVLTVAYETIATGSHEVVQSRKERNIMKTPEEFSAYLDYKTQEVSGLRDDLADNIDIKHEAYEEHYLANNYMSREDDFEPEELMAEGSREWREWHNPNL